MQKNYLKIGIITLLTSQVFGLYAQMPHNQPNINPPKNNSTDINALPTQSAFQAKDYSHLLGMPGFSDKLLNDHFKLYQGYVTNTNLITGIIQKLSSEGKNRSPEFAELRRRFGWEFDGMRLHEYYFENLGGKDSHLSRQSPLFAQIERDFGSFSAWKSDFIATGAMRGIGWAVLYLDPISGKLMNTWINEHDVGHLAGGQPILIMDVFEHAYMPDYGLDRGKYIEAFFNNINWEVVEQRFPVKKENANSNENKNQVETSTTEEQFRFSSMDHPEAPKGSIPLYSPHRQQ